MRGSSTEVIVIGPNGWVDVWPNLKETHVSTALAYHKRWWQDVAFYHRDGRKYYVAAALPQPELGPLSKALAWTVYNPVVSMRLQYRIDGEYGLNELKGAIRRAIATDDDIITQFHEASELIELLDHAVTFAEVCEVLWTAQRP